MQIIPVLQSSPIFDSHPKIGTTAQAEVPFSDMLKESIENLQEMQKVSNQDAYDLAMGNTDDIAMIAIHSAQATAALELTVQVASRAVNAYKEVLQMQI